MLRKAIRRVVLAYYETVFIARQDILAPQVDGLIDTFEKILKSHGGKITKKEQWGLRTLAYKIKKNRKGHYVLINIDGTPDAIHEMEKQMQLHEDVLRFLTIKVEALEEGPSFMMQNKDRDEKFIKQGRSTSEKQATHPSSNSSLEPIEGKLE
tara:strand:+ start:184 stop:642 length:459 start_codon:yes stop_codon:yes gene_type:complete